MNTQPVSRNYMISPVMLLILLIGGFIITTFAGFAKILHLEIAGILMPLGLLVQFPAWLIMIGDMIAQRLKYKSMWLIGMLFIPWLAMLLYLVQREKLIRMANR